MPIRSGTVSVSGIVPGFPQMFIDNRRGSFIARKKICDLGLSPLPMQTAFGYELYLLTKFIGGFAADFTEHFVLHNFIKHFPYLKID